jgi:hypothetical protein
VRHVTVLVTLVVLSLGCVVLSAYLELKDWQTVGLFIGTGGLFGFITGFFGYEA